MNQRFTDEQIKAICKDTLMEHLGIEFTHVSEGKVIATMPVDKRTVQPMKRLHGGATMALAESIGSIGSSYLVDTSKFHVLGVEISGSHVGTTNENEVIATGTLVHHGKTSHVWDIKVHDKHDKLISVCRLSCRIMPVKN